MRTILFFFLAFSCFYHVYCAHISFDSSKERDCLAETGGCAFNNVSIWINNTIPSTNDSVVISGTGGYSSPLLVFLPESYTVSVSGLQLQSANVEMYNQSSLDLSTLELSNTSLFYVHAGASLEADDESANFTLSASSRLMVGGNMNWEGHLLMYGQLSLSANATVLWGNTTYSPSDASLAAQVRTDYLTILPNQNVQFPEGLVVNVELALAGNCGATINDELYLGDIEDLTIGRLILAANTVLTLQNSASFLTCPKGVYGTGNISITNSQVNFNNPIFFALNGSVSVTGDSTVLFQHLGVRNLYLGSSSDNVTVIGSSFVVAQVADGYGSIQVQGGGLNISGVFAINGPISANNSQISISSTGSLILSGDLDFENTTVLLGGKISGDVEIPKTSFVNTTSQNTTIRGNVVNRGILHVAEDRMLEIYGNFTQISSGTLRVDLVNSNQSAINVTNAMVVIDGKLQYKMSKKPFLHNAKFPILWALNSTLSGSFINDTASAMAASTLHRELHVETEENIIYIKYDFSPKDVEAWEWAVIGVVGGLIIILALTCIFKFRANRHYEEIA